MSDQQTVTVPPAFRKAPINPYKERVEQTLGELRAMDTTPQPNPALNTPEPAQPPQSTQPQTAQPQQPAQSQQLAQQAVPYGQQHFDYMAAMNQQLEAERRKHAEEVAAYQHQAQQLAQERDQLQAFRQQVEAQAALSPKAFEGLESTDPNDAYRISAAVLNATQAPIQALRAELQQQRDELSRSLAQHQHQLQQHRVNELSSRVLGAHPDFYQFQHTPEYINYMSQRDGLSSKTRGERAAEEFMAGNTEYVIDMLNKAKGQAPSIAPMTTVPPVQVASSVQPAAAVTTPGFTLAELNQAMQTRSISHDEYRKRLGELRAQQQV